MKTKFTTEKLFTKNETPCKRDYSYQGETKRIIQVECFMRYFDIIL